MMKKFHFLIFVLFLFMFFSRASAFVFINEVMPHSNNPWQDEWIELYNPSDEILNLSGWKIGDRKSNDTITSLIIYNKSFALIVDANSSNNTGCLAFNIPSESCIAFSTIGDGLNDGNDSVFLYNASGFLVDQYSWTTDIKGSGNSWSKNNSHWLPCFPTPGEPNNCSQSSRSKKVELVYPSSIECDKNFSIIFKAYNFPFGLYDIKIDLLDENEHRVGKVWNGTKWLSTNSYVRSVLNVSSEIESATLIFKVENHSGEIVLRPRIRESGKTNYEEFDEVYSEVFCENNNVSEESKVKIVDAPKKAKFGSTILVEVEIYRGNTKKYATYIYVQDESERKVSEKVVVHTEKFSRFNDKLEIELKCLNESGTYEIVVDGLGKQDKEKIYLESCYEKGEEKKQNDSARSNLTSLINQSKKEIGEKEFLSGATIQDKSSEASKFLPYALASLGLLFTIYLIIKKLK